MSKYIKQFTCIAFAALSTSALLTYLGLREVYEGPTAIMLVAFAAMIIVYASTVTFFWHICGKLFIDSSRGLKPVLVAKVIGLALCVLLIVAGTSTVFNIISLSGKSVTRKQIEDRIGDIQLTMQEMSVQRASNLEHTRLALKALYEHALLLADLELSRDPEIPEAYRKGPQYEGFMFIANEIKNAMQSVVKQLRALNKMNKEGATGRFAGLMQLISASAAYEERLDVINDYDKDRRRQYREMHTQLQDAMDLIMSALENLSERPGQARPRSGSNKQPVSFQPDEMVYFENNHNRYNSLRQYYMNILHEQEAVRDSLNKIFLSIAHNRIEDMDAMDSEKFPSVRAMRNAFALTLLQTMNDMVIGNSVGEIVDLTLLDNIQSEAEIRIKTISNYNFPVNSGQEARKNNTFVPFFTKVTHEINRLKQDIEQQGNQTVGLREFREKFALAPIEVAVLDKNYRNIPMISFAVLIDFICLPLLGLLIVMQQRAREDES